MNAAPEQLDEILSIQFLVAWAEESAGPETPRLSWWETDVIDTEGGGDLWSSSASSTSKPRWMSVIMSSARA